MTRVVHDLNGSLHDLMEERDDVLVLGEDVLDPYGGAFKVTRGLSDRFPDRIITTPISEAGIVGVGIGLAMRGYRPIVEIMFGDFVTLIADQLINHASKFVSMYGEKEALPVVVRTPMGGRRGYGPTHSQTLERLFMGVPGLEVVAVSNAYPPGRLLRDVVETINNPVLFVENKILYTKKMWGEGFESRSGMHLDLVSEDLPTARIRHGTSPDVTLVTYGGMVPEVVEAADHLREVEGLKCEIIVPHRISPLDLGSVIESVRYTRRLVVVEEGVAEWGWGAEVVSEIGRVALEAPPQRVGAARRPIPANRELEKEVLPQAEDVVDAAVRTVDARFL